ncbi:MAG: tRNA pseudouridine(55) synthase TruB [Betaproteobacteria bacterium]|nr:tRNA pseudouridine(55) synthase TruB [Betaproteobacteria bacterium]
MSSRRRVDGLLVLDKPKGPSSTQVLGYVKRLFRASKAGHAGTLDPLASGLLPVMFGEATKFAQQGLESDKSYLAEIELGISTDSGDAEGEVLSRQTVAVSREQVQVVVESMVGPQLQVPPMHSALKHQGKPLYAYARAGEEVHREGRRIEIYSIALVGLEGTRMKVQLRCSKGTYVRVIAQEIGKRLGCGAHLAGLRRNGLGPLGDQDAVTLEQLEALAKDDPTSIDGVLLPVDHLIRDWPTVTLGHVQLDSFLHGRVVSIPPAPGHSTQDRVRVIDCSGRFFGTGSWVGGQLSPTRLLAQLG